MIDEFLNGFGTHAIIEGLISAFIAFVFVFWLFRPRLKIDNARINGIRVKVDVINQGCWSAVNLQVEMCAVNDQLTKHYKVDRDGFLILPPKKCGMDNVRTFKTCWIEDECFCENEPIPCEEKIKNMMIDELMSGDYIPRVRVHATHSISGLGRAFERKFRWRDGRFYPLERKYCFF